LTSAVAVTPTQLVTNAHVVEGETQVTLVQGDNTIPARVREIDTIGDRALLEVEPRAGLVPVPGARKYGSLRTGERVFTLGYPQGGVTFAEGLLSGSRTSRRKDRTIRLIQTSAPISPGSSGGGLFDESGNLIGVTTLFLKDAQNLNCAIAVDDFFAH
jgi:serine protease Do